MSVLWLTSKRIQLLLLFGTASTLGVGLCGAESIRNSTLSVSAWAGPQQQTCICRKLNRVTGVRVKESTSTLRSDLEESTTTTGVVFDGSPENHRRAK